MRAIPVLAYHSIAPGEKIEPVLFASHLDVLAASKLPSLSPEELGTAPKGFMLTFDDAFVDLWTHVFPLLKERRIKAMVFVIPTRTGDGDPRPQGKAAFEGSAVEAHAQACAKGLPHPAFLRWSEMAEMEASGLVTVQSHTMTHAMGWTGEEIVGFNLGRFGLGKLGKSHWSLPQATGGDVRLGIPIYKRGSAVANRLYFGDQELSDYLAEWIQKNGGQNYIKDAGSERAVNKLINIARDYKKSHPNSGRWETGEDRVKRTLGEMAQAREILEAKLGGKRDELCLPWGEYDETTLECARKVGIKRIYTLNRKPNPAGKIGFLVNRFEPRPKGGAWLRSRLAIYRWIFLSDVYGLMSGRR